MASARLQIIVDGDSEDGKKALDEIAKALGDLDKTTEETEKTTQSFWESTAAVAVGGAIANGISLLADGLAGVAQNMADVANAASDAKTILGDLTSEVDMGTLLNDAQLLASRFGVDTADAVNAVKTLMSEFGVTSDEAMSIVISGFERGLNTSGDFLDSIGEYSNLMADNGFRAEEFFSIMETGMAGGALGTDKAADAFKEFGIRIQEMGDDIFGPEGVLRTAVRMSDGQIAELYRGMQTGTLTVADAYKRLLPQIAAIQNPIERNRAGVALFGTQWEDLGAEAVLAINATNSGLGELIRQGDASRKSIATLGEVWPRLMTAVGVALLPLNDALVDMVNAFIAGEDPVRALTDALDAAGWNKLATAVKAVNRVLEPMFTFIIKYHKGIIGAFVGIATVVIAAYVPAMIAAAGASLAAAAAALPALLAMAPLIAAGIAMAAVGALIAENWDVLVLAFEAATKALGNLGVTFQQLGRVINKWLKDTWDNLSNALESFGVAIWMWIADGIGQLKKQLNNWWSEVESYFGTVLNRFERQMGEWRRALYDWLSSAWPETRAAIMRWWNSFTSYLEQKRNELWTEMKSWGPRLWQWILDIIPKLPGIALQFARAVWEAITAALTTAFRNAAAFGNNLLGLFWSAPPKTAAVTLKPVRTSSGQRMSAGYNAVAGGTVVNNYYNYAPVYSATPSRPSADFQLMQSMARAV